MVHTKSVTFPLDINGVMNSTNSTRCVVQLCNTAKQKCGRNTKCPITLPLDDGEFMVNKSFKAIDNTESSKCKSVIWAPQGTRRGTLSVKLSNPEQVEIARVNYIAHHYS